MKRNRSETTKATYAAVWALLLGLPALVLAQSTSITTQPQSQTVAPGAVVSFTVGAAANVNATDYFWFTDYRWFKDGVLVRDSGLEENAASDTLTINNVQVSDAGVYTVIVGASIDIQSTLSETNSVTSDGALLSVDTTGGAGTGGGTAVRTIDTTNFVVSISVRPASTVSSYTVRERLPQGWTASNISQSGAFNAGSGTVSWGPFAGSSLQTLTYGFAPPAGQAGGTVYFGGSANLGGVVTPLAGQNNFVYSAPAIDVGPRSQTIAEGDSASFQVVASGSGPLSYQWEKNGAALSGQTSATLALNNLQWSDAGSYSVIVSNTASAVTSNPAVLTVGSPIDERIIGLSGDLAMGTVTVGTTAQTTLTITNGGFYALSVSHLTYPSGFSGDWSGIIPPNGSTNVTVTFAPGAATSFSGQMSVSSDASSGNGAAVVSGSGIAALQWQSKAVAGMGDWKSIAFGNGRFVADNSANALYTSSDAAAWAANGSLSDYTGLELDRVRFVGGRFLLAGEAGFSGVVFESGDGGQWAGEGAGGVYPNDTAWGKGVYVAVGWQASVAVSADSTSWVSGKLSVLAYPTLAAAAFGNGQFVAVGGSAGGAMEIVTSADGTNWVDVSPAMANALNGVTFGAGQFVAVGKAGTVVTSADGTNWSSAHVSAPGVDLNDVVYGGGWFVAVGSGGAIVTSPSGVWWNQDSSPTTEDLHGATYADQQFYLVGNNGAIVASSPLGAPSTGSLQVTLSPVAAVSSGGQWQVDGGAWHDSGETVSGLTTGAHTVGFKVISGWLAPAPLSVTINTGQTATLAATYEAATAKIIGLSGSLAFGNVTEGQIVQSALIITNSGDAMLTVSSISYPAGYSGNWSSGTIAAGGSQRVTVTFAPTAVATYNGIITVVSDATGGSASITVSGAGVSGTGTSGGLDEWVEQNLPSQGTALTFVAYGGGTEVAVGFAGAILSSSDGTNWPAQISGTTNTLWSVTYAAGKFVVVGDSGTILTSSDGVVWASQNSGTLGYLDGIAYGNGALLAVGAAGTVLSSSDGVNWTSRNSGVTNELYAAGFGNGLFVAVGPGGTILTSPDGLNWSSRSAGTGADLYGVTYGASGFVVVGDAGNILRSLDGTTWVVESSGTTQALYGVAFAGGSYVVVGDAGTILSSSDGASWTSRNSGTTTALYSLGYGNGTFFAAGDSELILKSGTVSTPALTGSLEVTLSPAEAISAGARWQVDGGVWEPSGATVSGLSIGIHTVSFNTTSGWTAPTNQPATISANQMTSLTATYAPVISTDDHYIHLSGNLSFGNVSVGTTAQAALTISCTGNSPLTVSGITYPPGFSGPWSGTLAAGASTNVMVVFAPTAAGTYGGNLIVDSDANGGTNMLAVVGRGVSAGMQGALGIQHRGNGVLLSWPISVTNLELEVSASLGPSAVWMPLPVLPVVVGGQNTVSVDGSSRSQFFRLGTPSATTRIIGLSGNLAFGNVTVGASAQATLTIANSGNSTLTVTGISFPAGFSGNWSGTIAAGGSQNVTITFAPTAATAYSGTITIASDATGGAGTIAASGTGLAAPTKIISLSGSLAFGNVTVGTSAQATLTIANSGNSTLTVTGISLPAGFSGDWSSGTIAAGGSQNVTVTFAPTAATAYSGTITIASDATGGAGTIAVSGTGAQAASGGGLDQWAQRTPSGQPALLDAVMYANGQFVAVSANGLVQMSADGVTWSSHSVGASSGLTGITYGGGLYVAVGVWKDSSGEVNGAVWSSTDGQNWVRRAASFWYGTVWAVTYGNGLFVAVDDGMAVPNVVTSRDGINWANPPLLDASGAFYSVAYGNGEFVTVGDAGAVYRSADGTNWTAGVAGTTNALEAVTYGGGQFVAVGDGGLILTSPDGASWRRQTSGASQDLMNVGYGDGVFTAVGTSGVILTSSDGVAWTPRSSGTSQMLEGIAYGGGSFVVTGGGTSGGIILQSGSLLGASTRVIGLSGSLAFGNVTAGSTAQATLTIANSGTSTLTVSGLSYPPGFSGNWTSGTIAAGGSQTVTVTFAPTAATSYSGAITVTSDATSGTASIAVSGTGVAATGSGLPSPWLEKDIGNVGAAGSAAFANGAFTVQGSGADIWGTNDAFHFVYQPLNGDGAVVARVTSLTSLQGAIDPWAKAGVMIRESLEAGSPQAMAVVTPGNGVAFQYRVDVNDSSYSEAGAGATAPYWVKVARRGDIFTAYQSADGSTWVEIDSKEVPMTTQVYVGLALTAHSSGVVDTATFDQVQVLTSEPALPAITAFATPTTAQPVGASFTINYTVADAGGPGLASVELWRAPAYAGPFSRIQVASASGLGPVSGSFKDTPPSGGTYWYGLHAVDTAGNWMDERTADVGPLPVTVANSTASLPSLAPYQPSGWSDKIVVSTTTGSTTDSATLTPADALYVDWAVSNNGGAATSLRFYTALYVDGALWTSWYTDPPLNAGYYLDVKDFPIGSLSAGTHTLTLLADSTGAMTEANPAQSIYTKTIAVGAPSSSGSLKWQVQQNTSMGTGLGIAYGNGTFVSVNVIAQNTTAIYTSTDASHWVENGSLQQPRSPRFLGGMFLVPGGALMGGALYGSADGAHWSNLNTDPDLLLIPPSDTAYGYVSSSAYSGNVFVAAGIGDVVFYSEGTATNWQDGAILNRTSDDSLGSLVRLAYGGGQFVAVGSTQSNATQLVTSSDGQHWVHVPAPTSQPLDGVAFGTGLFAAVGGGGAILTSADGTNWLSQSSGVTSTLNDVAYADGWFVAAGDGGAILSSSDGSHWTVNSSGATSPLYGVTYANHTFYAVGGNGTVVSATAP